MPSFSRRFAEEEGSAPFFSQAAVTTLSQDIVCRGHSDDGFEGMNKVALITKSGEGSYFCDAFEVRRHQKLLRAANAELDLKAVGRESDRFFEGTDHVILAAMDALRTFIGSKILFRLPNHSVSNRTQGSIHVLILMQRR